MLILGAGGSAAAVATFVAGSIGDKGNFILQIEVKIN